MWSKLARGPVRLCRCAVNKPQPIVQSCSAVSTYLSHIDLRKDDAWSVQVTELSAQSPGEIAEFARMAYPQNGVLFVDAGQPFSQRFHAAYYVAMKKLGQFEKPADVLPLLALWLSYPCEDGEGTGRENDHYTQELCRHLLAMASQLTAADVIALVNAFRVPHITSIPEPILVFTSRWINAVVPHMQLSDVTALLQATGGLGKHFHSFFDTCCRRLLEAVGDRMIDARTLASCLHALSLDRIWSEQLVAWSADSLLQSGGETWTNATCHHVVTSLFNLGCVHTALIQAAVTRYTPDMQRNSRQCLEILHCCQLFDLYPQHLIAAVRAWLASKQMFDWDLDETAWLVERLLFLEITWTMSHPNEPPLLSDQLLGRFLRDASLKLPVGKISPGSILRYPYVYNFVAHQAGGNQFVATEVQLFTQSIDMLIVMDQVGCLLPAAQHPSTASPPLIPPPLATRIRLAKALTPEQIERMKWIGLPFRAIAIQVCEPQQCVRRTLNVDGETALQERFLSRLGYSLVRVQLDESGRFDKDALATSLNACFALPPKQDNAVTRFITSHFVKKEASKASAKGQRRR
ncbi:uncharacterized protein LOC135823411 [Sycon ciliatum]|uniref:uncharacterized protein LOC135823411 n=1 Tax=Sycon ciliatum TaxID=27933 RepID=UPI0031F6EC94